MAFSTKDLAAAAAANAKVDALRAEVLATGVLNGTPAPSPTPTPTPTPTPARPPITYTPDLSRVALLDMTITGTNPANAATAGKHVLRYADAAVWGEVPAG